MTSELTKIEKQTILLVDDESTNIKILNEILQKDYKIMFATTGQRAIQLAVSKKPDLIILDIIMPEMDGYSVCKELKQNPETKNILVIFITVKDHSDDETKGLELGAVDYITKPINPSVVKARVRTHLSLMLARRELEIKNKELIEAASLREDIEIISRHDLKTPLNGIINLPQLIADEGPLNDEQLEYLTIIENSGYQMLNIINMSLNLCKMERGTYLFLPQTINLIQVIKKIQSELKNIIELKEITFSIFIDNRKAFSFERFLINGEEFLIYSMMANLIKNAIEASPEKESISIFLNHDTMDEIRINNAGTVPDKVRDNFFSKYSTYGKESGMGLGTYSAKMMVEVHSGTIELKSDKEKGTDIIVKLPKKAINLPADNPIRVLIVEDSKTECLFIENILKKDLDIEVIDTTIYGKEAIQKSKKLKPDVITMDIMLPDMNGVEVAKEILKNETTPIIFVTALTHEENTRKSLDLINYSSLDVMPKPSRSEDWTQSSWSKDLIAKIKSLYLEKTADFL